MVPEKPWSRFSCKSTVVDVGDAHRCSVDVGWLVPPPTINKTTTAAGSSKCQRSSQVLGCASAEEVLVETAA